MKEWLKQLPQKQISSSIDFLMVALGTIGLVGGLGTSLYFTDYFWIAMIIFVVFGWILYGFHKQHVIKKSLQFIIFIYVFSFMYLFLFINEVESMLGQFKAIIEFDYFLRFDELFKNTQTTQTLLPLVFFILVGMPIVYLIVSLITQKKGNLFKISICLLIFLFPIVIRHQLNSYTSYCFVAFLIYQFLFSYTLKDQHNQFSLKVIVLMSLSVFLLFSSYFLEPNPIFKKNTSIVLTNITNWVDNHFFQEIFGSHNRTGVSSSVTGTLPDDSVTLNNGIALEVEATYPFTSYLRGYSLAQYEDNRWKPISENYEDSKSVTYYSDYIRKNNLRIDTQLVKIISQRSTSYQFVPYYSLINDKMIADSYYRTSDDKVRILVGGKALSYEESENYEKIFRADYDKFVQKEYLDVPESLRSKLVEYIEENNSKGFSLSDMSSYYLPQDLATEIRELLSATTQYDLNSGKLPDDQDFVDYFLFQNKKGSCTHYATTGTLLLRCLGIPARYVSGFVIKADDFQNGVATIRNHRSHAWVEIYVEGEGWIPCEMTPTSDNSGSITELGTMLDGFVDNNTTAGQTTHPNQPTTQTPAQNNQTTHQPLQNTETETLPWYTSLLEYSQYMIAAAIGCMILILYRFISLKAFFIRLRRQSMNRKVIVYYQRMQRILKFGGEIDKNIMQIVYKAKFSQHTITDEEYKIIQNYYLQLTQTIYQSLPLYKRFVFKFIFGYK